MSPVHGSPYGAVGVVLVEEMIGIVVEHQSVGVVHPVCFGSEVEEGSVGFFNWVFLFRVLGSAGCKERNDN